MTDLRSELEAIYHQHGTLTPQLVVDTARSPEHPLHPRFEWDNQEAGERYRVLQAAELIRSVRVVYKTDETTGTESRRRAYVSTGQNNRPSAYLPTEQALADPITRELVLRQFQRAILALRRQYGHLIEYESMLRAHGLGQTPADDAA